MNRGRGKTPFLVVLGKPRRRRRGQIRSTGMSERKKAYLAYMRSPAWRSFRTAWWAEYDKRNTTRKCYCCEKTQSELKSPLELHHRTYERLGAERWDDLVAACRTCHRWITQRQRSRSTTMTIWEITEARKRSMLTYQARRNTAMGKE